jgi:hypothetical protein
MSEKQTNKERLKDITDSIERGIQDLFQSDKYAQYLRTMSRFHRTASITRCSSICRSPMPLWWLASTSGVTSLNAMS